jgi:hypothetical protein
VLVAVLSRNELRRLPRDGWRAGLIVGALLAAGNVFQATALQRTSASAAGLITGLFVIATPLLGWILLRTATSRGTWIASAVCVAGLALLSGHTGGALIGNGLALLAAGDLRRAHPCAGHARSPLSRSADGHAPARRLRRRLPRRRTARRRAADAARRR